VLFCQMDGSVQERCCRELQVYVSSCVFAFRLLICLSEHATRRWIFGDVGREWIALICAVQRFLLLLVVCRSICLVFCFALASCFCVKCARLIVALVPVRSSVVCNQSGCERDCFLALTPRGHDFRAATFMVKLLCCPLSAQLVPFFVLVLSFSTNRSL
jgi:hypothetical protein